MKDKWTLRHCLGKHCFGPSYVATRCFGLLCVFTLLLSFGHNIVPVAWAELVDNPEKNAFGKMGRTDKIVLRLNQAEKPQLPPVTFLHDKHTQALAREGKGCETCHSTTTNYLGGKSLSLNFMQASASMSITEAKKYFHANCTSCHLQTSANNRSNRTGPGVESGPRLGQCRACHSERNEIKDTWREISMDKNLHYRHISSNEIAPPKELKNNDQKSNCAACHHVFEAKSKKLIWQKDAEDNCRACHGQTPQRLDNGANPPSLRVAVHSSCVSCHHNIQLAAKEHPSAQNYRRGPLSCAGCHSKEGQGKIERLSQIPRLERGQPDAILLVGQLSPPKLNPKKAMNPKGAMRPVAFDHKRHETASSDCRTCHHVRITSCNSCHTLDASEKSGGVNLAQAMHAKQSDRSCVGCHSVRQAAPECASCHGFVRTAMNPNSCAVCHQTPPGVSDEQARSGILSTLSRSERLSLGAAAVAARQNLHLAPRVAIDGMLNLSSVPEFVTIDQLSQKFESVKMPHRRILQALAKGIGKNALANTFHNSELSLCQGCHHQSPPSTTPPSCVSCHGVTLATPDGRPGLQAAYHQQCMGCHSRLNLKKPASTNCESCHKKRLGN